MLSLKFEVKRHRASVTQGEVEVFINGKLIVRFQDEISLNGKYGDIIDGWGSELEDDIFIKATLKNYGENIIEKLW